MSNNKSNYATIYCSLHKKAAKKLRELANKQGKTESEVLRQILDVYLQDIEKKGLPYEPLRKFSPVGLKLLARTITKEQDERLRFLAEKTGRGISELVREAVEEFGHF